MTEQTTGTDSFPFHDPNRPIAERLTDLMTRLTLDEKIGLLSVPMKAVPRLGIPAHCPGNEALHGVVRPGKATVFPQAIGLAATWNSDLLHRIGAAISDEARAKYNETQGAIVGRYSGLLQFYSPVVNMARDPRWGRTQETFGEDPRLTAKLAVAFIRGMQGDDPDHLKAAATPKHFAANNEEHNRFSCKTLIPERSLREYYLPAFKACVMEGQAASIMSAYNAISGVPCTANARLLSTILREEWRFDGFVVSDAGAVGLLDCQHHYTDSPEDSAVTAIKAGLDQELGSHTFQDHLAAAAQGGKISEGDIDRAVARVVKVYLRLGWFDPWEQRPYAAISPELVGCPAHAALALESARQSMVLLQNRPGQGLPLLPISFERVRSLAVVGPNADRCQFGDYSGVPVHEPISPLQGLRARAGTQVAIHHVPWTYHKPGQYVVMPREYVVPKPGSSLPGFQGEYFNNPDLRGAPDHVRTDPEIDFLWAFNMPDPNIPSESYSVRWTAVLTPPVSGAYTFSFHCGSGLRWSLDHQVRLEHWTDIGPAPQTVTVTLEKGRAYHFQLEFYCVVRERGVVRVLWDPPHDATANAFAYEVAAARRNDLVVAVMGLSTQVETEGLDRTTLELPPEQVNMLQKIAAVNPRIVVVLVNGSPLAIPWIQEQVPAILEAWYPGEQGGLAIADVLLGLSNPAGRLPVTFYQSVAQLPPFNDYDITHGRTYMYLKQPPLFPFGHGLSYTTFEYSNLRVSHETTTLEDRVAIEVDIENTGDFDGDEVVQIYVKDIEASTMRPSKQLIGFQRIYLVRGEKNIVKAAFATKDLSFYHEQENRFIVEPGEFEILVGSSSEDIRLKGRFRVE